MNQEIVAQPKKIDWRIPRLIGSRFVAAVLISSAMLSIKSDVDRANESIQAIENVECLETSVNEPPCDTLQKNDQSNTDNRLISVLLIGANLLIATDTVSRYRRFRAASQNVEYQVNHIYSEIESIKSQLPEKPEL